MRVAYPAEIGGLFANAGQAVAERALLTELLRAGLGVRLIAFGDRSEQERLRSYASAELAGTPLEIVFGDAAGTASDLDGVDALVLHSLPQADASAWLQRLDPVSALPTVQYVHSLILTWWEQEFWGRFWSRWSGWPPARLVAPSRCTAARARTLGAAAIASGGRLPPVDVIPLGVDASAFADGDRAAGRERLGIDPAASVILSVNRLSAQKAEVSQLVVCFRDLLASSSVPLFLVLAGSASSEDEPHVHKLEEDVRRLGIAERVRVIVDFDEAEKQELYAAADVFVSLATNPQESFGIALLEAMAAGLPVVATDWDGYPETLPSVYEPYLVPTIAGHTLAGELSWKAASDACAPTFAATASRLTTFVGDPALRAHLGACGREVAAQHSWGRAARSLIELLERLIADFRSGRPTVLDEPPPPARSIVDGLATAYLEDDPILCLPGTAGDARPLRPALDMMTRRAPPVWRRTAQVGRHRVGGQTLWRRIGDARRRRSVLRALAAAGESGVAASVVRARTRLPRAQADWLLLQLVRCGIVEVVGPPSKRARSPAPPRA